MPRPKYKPPTEGGKSTELSTEDQETVEKLQNEIIEKEELIDEIYNKS